MVAPLLKTKLYIPPVRAELVPRPRLIERLNAGTHPGHKLTRTPDVTLLPYERANRNQWPLVENPFA